MKRLVYSSSDAPHLSDLISRITQIIICNDIDSQPTIINSSEDLDDDEDMTDEQSMVTWSDEQLMELTRAEVAQLSNFELLNKIARLDRTKLSKSQLQLLQKLNKQKKFIVDKEDVIEVLNLIKRCKDISYLRNHVKTERFATDSNGDFRKDECMQIIKNLTVADYVTSGYSNKGTYLGNNVIIFQPTTTWKLNNGMILKDFTVYIKFDIDESTGNTLALISFHDTILNDPHPYA